jgi:hypothetical protein
MSRSDSKDVPEMLSPQDMQQWLQREISDCTKALELRIKEATAYVSAYAGGQITTEEADERHWRYLQRWGEPLPARGPKTTDEQIIAAIDEFEGPYTTAKQNRETYKRVYGRNSGESSRNR